MKVNFNFKNVGILEDKIEAEESKLLDYTEHLKGVLKDNSYLLDEASLYLPFDTAFYNESLTMAENYKSDKLKYVFVVGIGGSNLGTMAIYNAIYGTLDALNPEKRFPKLVFIETTSAKYVEGIFKLIDNQIHTVDEFLVNIISKSGGTTETVALAELLIRKLESRFVKITDRIIVTTDKSSKFESLALANEYKVLSLPQKVGGRYSVFSNVGLFPLALAGIDIERLLEGAKVALVDLVNTYGSNPSLRSAVVRFLSKDEGNVINNQFYFNPELEYCGKWYRQLMGESIGKQNDINGNKVNAGIAPIVSIGSTDLHSMVQLFIGGPKNILTYFVYSPDNQINQKLPDHLNLEGLVTSIENKTTVDLMDAILKGTKSAYTKNNLPFVEVEIPIIDEYTVGMYLQYQMLEMMYLAKLMNVNAFDQPNVEDYKIETKKILGE